LKFDFVVFRQIATTHYLAFLQEDRTLPEDDDDDDDRRSRCSSDDSDGGIVVDRPPVDEVPML
jgi:hypothetical protein